MGFNQDVDHMLYQLGGAGAHTLPDFNSGNGIPGSVLDHLCTPGYLPAFAATHLLARTWGRAVVPAVVYSFIWRQILHLFATQMTTSATQALENNPPTRQYR